MAIQGYLTSRNVMYSVQNIYQSVSILEYLDTLEDVTAGLLPCSQTCSTKFVETDITAPFYPSMTDIKQRDRYHRSIHIRSAVLTRAGIAGDSPGPRDMASTYRAAKSFPRNGNTPALSDRRHEI